MKTTLRIAAITATIASTIQAETIVKWGDSPADTNIVTANARGLNQFGTSYDAASIGSPEDGTSDYALGIAGQTRTFYGAMSTENTVPIVNNSGAGDRIQVVHNFKGDPGALTSMIVWQASEFLTDSRALDSMTVSYASRGGDGTTISFLIETTSGWYQSDQTDMNATNVYADFSGTSASITWSPFSEFDVTAGEGGADTTDIKSVGLYSSSTNTSSNFIGGLVANFEVTAVSVTAHSLGITAFEFDEAGNLQIDFTGAPNTVYGVEFSPDLSTPFAPVTDLTATTDSSGDGFVPISAEEITSSKGFYRIVSAP
jgi:hypothetical protein